MAVTTTGNGFPCLLSFWKRLVSRICAFQAISRTTLVAAITLSTVCGDYAAATIAPCRLEARAGLRSCRSW